MGVVHSVVMNDDHIGTTTVGSEKVRSRNHLNTRELAVIKTFITLLSLLATTVWADREWSGHGRTRRRSNTMRWEASHN